MTTQAGETYAEVAHEAIFRRWDKLRESMPLNANFSSGGALSKRRGAHGRRHPTI